MVKIKILSLRIGESSGGFRVGAEDTEAGGGGGGGGGDHVGEKLLAAAAAFSERS